MNLHLNTNIMNFENDIIDKIEKDFQFESQKAIEILEENINKENSINHPRIIRSILYLSNGNIFELKHNIKTAISDWRDVIYFAEYDKNDSSSVSRKVRDFNLPFNKLDML